jgi:Transposase DDE domain
METGRQFDENWNVLLSLLPLNWELQAFLQGAAERSRGFESVGALLRTLLLHVGKGYSLRETTVRAKAAGLAEVSDVALLKRLRKAEPWLQWLCVGLAEESGWEVPIESRGWNVRAVDGTLVKEPGRGGSLWRIHYSLRIPGLVCDHFELTSTKGRGVGETLARFAASAGDLVLADRGFCTPTGVEALTRQGAATIVRLNTSTLPLFTAQGERFNLLEQIRPLTETGVTRQWPVWVHGPQRKIEGRLCALRKSEQATRKAVRKIQRKSQQGGPRTKPETLEYARYVMVFTTLPNEQFSSDEILEWYRVRWQIELVFKRMKSLAQLGHLPKHDPQSARAWLYGKLLVALLGQKLMRLGRDISPWGYRLAESWKWQRVAGL